jgi:transcriptional regulator with XRE-family HTH domain
MAASDRKRTGRHIRQLRKSRNLSQAALASAVGVHENTIMRWERKGVDPHHKIMPSIAAVLGDVSAGACAEPSGSP